MTEEYGGWSYYFGIILVEKLRRMDAEAKMVFGKNKLALPALWQKNTAFSADRLPNIWPKFVFGPKMRFSTKNYYT